MALTPEDVVNQKFTITKFRDGYDLDQVDDFLDTIVEELRQHEQEKEELRAQIADLTEKLEACEASKGEPSGQQAPSEQTIVVDAPVAAPAPVPAQVAPESAPQADAVKSSAMLQLALELHDKHVQEGETTRDKLIAEAETKRDQMIEDAERTAKQLVEEAQKQRADELRVLGEERSELQFKIKDLRQFESEYRSTLRSYIQSQLRSLDGSPEPAGAPDGLQ
ncbi:DivIVA domain-containing protein [Leucobacter sp. wl10]|uniref:DivIVA domain-containing protein n=1 Tax=Leucobacter sp. wl10 TaxID=2304677 RepID=UPI000E5C28DF|nr:DivIVA domain-containing protein [Leucobacter sp. wl10]RGE22530.1 DivIVA domain-containing protein [Leucobacter sp. wl10]